jgi:hypothetical protein
MHAPLLVASTDPLRKLVVMTLEGSTATAFDVEPLRMVVSALPIGHSLIVDVTNVGTCTAGAVAALRSIGTEAAALGETMIVVCADLERRMNLVLADLDSVVAVVASVDQAIPLTHAA